MTYAFADFVLDHRLYELRRSGRIVKLEPKVFDVLAYLVANRDRVVAKDELLDRLWPGEFVSESVLPRCVAAARKALADDSSAPKIIQTVHGRGYRFIASARTLEDAAAARAHGNLGTTSRTAPAPAATPAADRAPFVGRTQAMEALSRGLEDALAGRGRLLLLVGEPGIGKTRTAEEIAVAAEARGMRALYGRSYESAGAPAFWPWTQILRACIADSSLRPADGTSVDEYVAQLLPEMHAGVAAAAAQDSLAPEHARFRLFDAVTALLRRAAAVRPLLLVLDDLHWTDKPSLLLLQFLARELRDAHILVVGTYRDVALGRHHPLAEVLAELAREPVHARVLLRGLTEVESVNYIAAVADRPAPAPVVHAVHEMTDGNPFFLGEVVRLLVCEARLERGEAALQGLALPQGLREAIGRRLDALSKECNGLLTVAAVIGREFSLTLLERVIGFDRAAILDLVDEAATARIVARAPQTLASYAFSHALVREALYEEISTPTRVQLHRRVADAIEQSSGADPGARLAEIAHHLFQAAPGGDVARAVSYCVRAAQRAARLLAYEEAARHYERALEAAELEALDDERRVELLLELGEMQSCSGERDRSRATFDRAAAIARAAGMPRSLARAALGFGGRGEMGMPLDEPLKNLLDEALAALGEDDQSLRAMLLALMAGTAPYYESVEARMDMSAEALRLARASGDPATLIKALSSRGWAMLGPDHVSERLEVATELLAIAERSGDKVSAFLGREYRQGAYLALGDIAAVDREIAAAARLADEMRQPIYRWFATWWRASRAVCDGRFDDAEVLRHEALEIGQRVQIPGAPAIFAGQGLWISYERTGSTEAPEPGFEYLLTFYPRAAVPLRAGEALFHCLAGRDGEARASFEKLAARDFGDIARDEHWLSAMTGLAEVCAHLGDRVRARLLYDALAPFAERNCVHDLLRTYSGSVAHYLALLAASLGDTDAAAAHYESALAMNERLGAKPYVGRTQYEYARMLRGRKRAGDQARAAGLLADCGALARAVGLRALEARVRALEDSKSPKEILKHS